MRVFYASVCFLLIMGFMWFQKVGPFREQPRPLDESDVPLAMFRKMLNTKESSNRALACLGIKRVGPYGATELIPELLITLKEDRCPFTRGCAAEALGSMGAKAKEAIPDLIKALEDEDLVVVTAASRALRLMGREAFPAVTGALNNPNDVVRQAAANCLAKGGLYSYRSVPVLWKMSISDSSCHVRERAGNAVREILGKTPLFFVVR